MYVRWLGAFAGKNVTGNDGQVRKVSLCESMVHELTCTDQKACEYIRGKKDSMIKHVKLGLLVNQESIFRTFNGDCWSEKRNGRLVPTRDASCANSNHKEAFLSTVNGSAYSGIVIKGSDMTEKMKRTLRFIAKQYNLPIYRFRKGCLSESHV